MNTRLLILTVLTLTSSDAWAQAPAPALPAQDAPSARVGELPEPAVPPLVLPQGAPRPGAEGQPLYVQPAQPVLVQPGPSTWAPPHVVQPAPRRRYPVLPPVDQAKPESQRRHGQAGAPFALGVGGDLLWRHDRAQHVLSTHDRNAAFDVFATYDVWSPLRSTIVSVGASFRSETHLGNGSYDLRNNTVQAELMARYGVTSWFWPHLRAAVGGVVTRYAQHDRQSDLHFEQHDGAAVGTFGGGFTLRTPTRLFETRRGRLSSLSFGLLIEGGYIVAPDAHLSLQPTRGGEVPRSTFSLGSVERSAPYLRIMGVIRI